ncbi:hypothetical protein [Microbacterium sp. XT11]|uniref:hypothetical protein n=1 Tax=Microbacterium sp. XT11 TaxID=367477 RepID=UPI00082CFFE5|nr:hypothetical protein [Microbacterium sp. XT11]
MNASTLLLAGIAAGVGVIGVLLSRASPRLTFVLWALVLFFVPVWLGVTVGFFWSAITLLTLVAVVTSISDIRLNGIDLIMAVFALMAAVLFALKAATLAATVIALLEWVLPYVWGRLVLARLNRSFVTRVLAAVAVAAAVFGLVEFATGTNVFVMLPSMSGDLYATWGTLQVRADRLRVEGAWGHSIALGAGLAMSSAFVVAARWPVAVRLIALGLLAGATVTTISRIGMLTLVFTVVLAVLLLPGLDRAMRWSVAALTVLGALVVIPFVGTIFSEAGDEAGGSADYRTGLFSLVSQVQVFGGAGDWTGRTVGGEYLGAYAKSIDNAFLVFALRFGWIPSLLLLAALVAVGLSILRPGKASPPAIAVAAQLPAIFAVALITQAGSYLWFLVGLAVAWWQSDDGDDQEARPSLVSMSRTNADSVFASRR